MDGWREGEWENMSSKGPDHKDLKMERTDVLFLQLNEETWGKGG